MSAWNKHQIFEKNSFVLLVGILVAVAIGGLVEIAPLFYLKSTIEKTEGMRPYTPLELAGRDIYVREGCYLCHSQMVRPMRDEIERYGHFSLAAESMYDRPFQWGSKRTGPDLARVGGKYSDDWHVEHLVNPRSLVPASIMPGYPFLAENRLETRDIKAHLEVNSIYGVPYTEAQIESAASDVLGQAMPDSDAAYEFEERWPTALIRDFDGNPKEVTEMDALVAYLQVLGTMVDFSIYDDAANAR
ncbi:cytochrome-c oxidase, cbb3-type subunit II [Roseibium sp. MMSF_3544]|uniref:cytochrome-c oxidase, cbb3-type subunit II n=1 Tax=unclassified Roseibium TaxID=2629323 RepID=UPI00273FEC87|nr:cytochrome-c oxidase, cbb3-type subunit II [Roseibium sp. MMSF_3544]